jgi:hypothetical protein
MESITLKTPAAEVNEWNGDFSTVGRSFNFQRSGRSPLGLVFGTGDCDVFRPDTSQAAVNSFASSNFASA